MVRAQMIAHMNTCKRICVHIHTIFMLNNFVRFDKLVIFQINFENIPFERICDHLLYAMYVDRLNCWIQKIC